MAEQLGTKATAMTINAENPAELGNYGIDSILAVSNEQITQFNAKAYAEIIKQAAKQTDAHIIVVSSSANAKYLAPLLAVNLEAGYASNVIALPTSTNPFVVKRTAFSNKAFNYTEINTPVKVIGLSGNSFGLKELKTEATITSFSVEISEADLSIKVTNIDKVSGKLTIADADIVVSGGRGLKGPENWGMIEELAEVLGAATACSKPVSDLGWRPHSEHVGQTGKPVATNLYIAIGISGAIQHLAGVNASKVKVVINSDPEAPFFKAADYGVVGDAFTIVPELIQKLKEFKASNA